MAGGEAIAIAPARLSGRADRHAHVGTRFYDTAGRYLVYQRSRNNYGQPNDRLREVSHLHRP